METCEQCRLPFATAANDLSRYDEKCFTRFPTAASVDGCRWAQWKRKRLHAEPMVIAAIADARRAALLEAVKIAERESFAVAAEIAAGIRVLIDAPGTPGRGGETP